MSNRNPIKRALATAPISAFRSPFARVGSATSPRFGDRLDPSWNGLTFERITSRRAQLAAWEHDARIVNRKADHGFDYSA